MDGDGIGDGHDSGPGRGSGHLDDIVTAATDLLADSASLIEAQRSKFAFDRCGYHLFDVLKEDGLDVAGLLVGSEGTLAMITEATLKTIPLPRSRSVAVLGFASLEGALSTASGHGGTAEGSTFDVADMFVQPLWLGKTIEHWDFAIRLTWSR